MPSVLENPNIGPTDSLTCFRLQDKFFQNSFSKVSTIYPNIGSGGTPNIPGGERIITKRGHTKDPFYQRRFLQPPVSCTQKGRIYASGDRLEFSEQVHRERAFPDGKPQLSKDVAFTRRFYDKYRLKRCLPFCSRSRVFPKVSSLRLERHMLPVQSSSFRAVFSPQDFYENFKTCCCIPEEEVHSYPYIPGRLSSLGCNNGGSCGKYSVGSYSPSFPRFYSKPPEVVTNSNTSDNLPGFQNRLDVHDDISPDSKSQQDSGMLSPFSRFSKYHIAKPSKFNRSFRVLETSHLASSTPLSPLAVRSDKGPTFEPGVLRCFDCSFTECQSRSRLVVETHPQCKRQSCAPSSSGCDHNDRRLQERLGCSASIPRDQWQMVTTRVSPAYQLSRTKGGLFGCKSLSQRQVSRNGISASRQHDRHRLCQQQRGYTLPPTSNSGLRDVGLVPGKRHLRDSFSHPRKRERLCGQRVESIQGHERVEVGPINYSALSTELSDGSLCESSNQPTRGLHQLETRPGSHPHRRLYDQLGSSTGLCLPSLQSDIQDSREGNHRPNGTSISRPSVASPALVAGSVETSNISASVASEQSNPLNGPHQSEQSPSNVSSTSLGRVSHLYQRFQAEGIPTNVADLLIAATRTSTHKTYESSWNRWCRWCSGRQIDPLSSSINDILIFLTEVFNEGLAYRSLNVIRSAISSTHPKIDGFSVGQHPYVTRLLKGVLNKRPPKPRYSHTWNVDVMIKYMISLGKNSTLALKVLSMKLLTLFALTCPERISALASLDLRHCSVRPEGVSFKLTVPRKSGSADKPAEAFFARFNQDKKLCPVECFRQYLKLSRNVRPVIPSSLPDKLFISFKRPHKPVTSTTLGRWLRTFMSAAGIDSHIFKAHSVRGASTTAAANAFVPLSTIMSMADWSSASTFRTFYYKPVFNSDFATGVLSSK